MSTKTRNILGVLIGIGLTVAIIISFVTLENEKSELVESKTQLKAELEQRDSAYNEIINVMYEVESKIDRIKKRENLISEVSNKEITRDTKEEMVRDMIKIDSLIIQTNETVARLVSKLNNANMNLNSFKDRIGRLSKDLEERKQSIAVLREDLKAKDVKIAGMTADIQSLEYQVNVQEETITTQNNKIEEVENEMNKAYFAIGTEKSLKEDGLVAKEGGFLGLGKTTELRENAKVDKFSQIDIRTTNRLIVDAEDVNLITEHPKNSYEIVKENDIVKFIEIKNPDEFWRISRYLVVAVKS